VLVQRYELFVTDLPAAVAEIAQHLAIAPKPGEIARIARKLNLERQRNKRQRWKPAFFDSTRHINQGEIGSWRHQLDPAVADEITVQYSDWLVDHGYPVIALPEAPEPGDEACFVPHTGWLAFERGDAVLSGLRAGDFEFAERAFFHRVLRAGDTVVDCGAHAGLYTRLAAPLVAPNGCVHAIEPAPRSFARLQQNIAGLPAGVCHLHPLALGAKNAEINFVALDQGRSAYNHVAGPDETGATIPVRQLTLPQFARQAGLARIDFLKIDAEGQEWAILNAAAPLLRKGAIQVLMIEFNQENLTRYGASCQALADLLTGHGYQFLALDRSQFRLVPARPSHLELYANYFAVRDVPWLQARFADAPLAARAIAADLVLHGAQVHFQRQGHLASLAEQNILIANLRKERDYAVGESQKARLELESMLTRLQGHIDQLTAQLARTATEHQATIDALRAQLELSAAGNQVTIDGLRTQLESSAATSQVTIDALRGQLERSAADSQVTIDGLRTQLDRAVAEGQATIDTLRTELERVAATSREQTAYVVLLEKERDRLAADAAQFTQDSAHYVQVLAEQTTYIRLLEQQRDARTPPAGA
jgi:FkbM family methyltransferase